MDANDGGWINAARSQTDEFNPYAPPRLVDESPEDAKPAGPLPGSPPGISVTYRNNAADIAAYARYFTTKFTKHRRNLRLIMGLILTVFVFQTVAFRNVALEGYRAPIMIGGMVALWIWLEFASSRRKLTHPVEMPLVTLTLTPSGIVTREENGGGAHRAWSAIRQIDDTNDHIYIFEEADKTRVVMAHVVPRRSFPSREAADEFLATARRWHADPEDRPPVEVEPESVVDVEQNDERTESLAVTFTMGPEDRRAELAFYRSQRPKIQTSNFILLFGVFVATPLILSGFRRDGSPIWRISAVAVGVVYLAVGLIWWWRRRFPSLPDDKEGAGTPLTIRI
ncbi:MAG: YcxB family protein, partial [Isosphaeraceae bacterium]